MSLVARIHHSLAEIPAFAWATLATHGSPFLAHAFLDGLERTGCIRRELGWRPHHVALYRGDVLVAAAPCYLKANSHGEFVFDFSWAQAHERAGLDYYPKLLVAVPYLVALPALQGKYEPILNGRYVMPILPLVFASIGLATVDQGIGAGQEQVPS